jgi:predicted amidohydrolase YtcJ
VTDTILIGARILTMDPARPEAQALAIRDGRILALGQDGDIRALARPGARVIAAGGRLALPGLIDAHVHLMDGGRGLVLSAQLGHRPEPTCRPPAQPRHDARRGKAEGQSAKLEAQP